MSPPTPTAPSDQSALVVLGSVWDDDGCKARIRSPGQPSELIPAVGLELNYRVAANGPRHCIGHTSPRKNNGAYVDCPNTPQANERTCVSCAVADAEFAGDLHHAHTKDRQELDRSVVDHLEQTNILYLAAFRDGSIKVGTSTGHRKHKRLTEQGAWRAVEVATVADGFLVRRLEDLVTEKLGLTQSVAVKRKLHGMANPLSEAMLGERLDPLVAQVHHVIADTTGEATASDTDDPPATATATAWSFPGADDPVWQGLHLYPARLDAGTHHVEVVAMCGRMAVLARPGSDDRFIADFGQLFGIELDIGSYQADLLAVQDSLF